MRLKFSKAWAYIEKSHCVNIPAGFEGDVPEKHAKDAVKGKYATEAKPKKAAKVK